MEEDLNKEGDVEVMEFALCDDEIDELIMKLQLLKEEKEKIYFDIDEKNELVIHYDNQGEEE